MADRPEWFAAKRYGYGSGWPIAWQGWALLAAFMAVVTAVAFLLEGHRAAQFAILVPTLAILVIVTARTTRGGWR